MKEEREAVPMISIRAFGPLDLRNAAGDGAGSVTVQPKRTAVLAYLALATPRGFHHRDTLVGLLWPELTDERARAALSKAVHHLRRSLGAGAIVSRGNEALAIDPERMWCDVVAFEDALDAGRREEALELYRGELLQGFFVSDALEFERWLELRRAELSNRARRAAGALADEASAAGDLEKALEWARRAAAIAPDDEGALRSVITLLHRTGNGATALGLYDDFAARLEREHHGEPDPETRRLIEAVRCGDPGAERRRARTEGSMAPTMPPALRESAPQPAFESAPRPVPESAPEPAPESASEPAPAAAPAPGGASGDAEGPPRERAPGAAAPGRPGGRSSQSGQSGQSDQSGRGGQSGQSGQSGRGDREGGRPGRQRPTVTYAVAALAFVALGLSAAVARFGAAPPQPPPPSPSTLAVFPFAVHGDGEMGYLREGMVSLLGGSLDGVGDLTTVDPRTLLARVGPGSDPLATGDIAEIAASVGAELVVVGDVTASPRGALRISAGLYESGMSDDPLVTATVGGEADRLFELVDALAVRLLQGAGGAPALRPVSLAAHTTPSLDALRAYLQAEREARQGQFETAMEAYGRALAADSAFALAHYGLSVAANWSGRFGVAEAAANEALAHPERLSRQGRLRARAWLAYISGRTEQAEPLYRALVGENPTDAEAWFYLAELGFHYGPQRGRPITESREAWERVLVLEPDNAGALIHLARIAALEGRTADLRALADSALRFDPAPRQRMQLEALRALLEEDGDVVRRIAAELDFLDHGAAHSVVLSSAVYGRPAGAARLALSLVGPERPVQTRIEGRILRAHLLAGQGRIEAAEAELRAMEPLAPIRSLEYRAMIAGLPFVASPPGPMRSLRDALAAVEEGPPPPASVDTAALGGAGPARRLYLRGLLSVRLGEPDRAVRLAGDIEAFGGEGPRDSLLARTFARTLRAEIALDGGAPGEALAVLEKGGADAASLRSLRDHPLAYEAFLRAEALAALGRGQEALRWYATYPDATGYNIVYLPASHLRRAAIHEARGDIQASRRHHERFRSLWAGPPGSDRLPPARFSPARLPLVRLPTGG